MPVLHLACYVSLCLWPASYKLVLSVHSVNVRCSGLPTIVIKPVKIRYIY